MNIYDFITLEQALIGFFALFCAALIGAGGDTKSKYQACLLIGLGLNEPYWSLAREAFAGSAWMYPFTTWVGISGKVDFEDNWVVIIPKSMMLIGVCGWAWTGRR